MRTDVIKTYKDVHSWVGIVAGLMLAGWWGRRPAVVPPLVGAKESGA